MSDSNNPIYPNVLLIASKFCIILIIYPYKQFIRNLNIDAIEGEDLEMECTVCKLSYEKLCDRFHNLEYKLNGLNKRKKATRIIFDHPLYFLRKGLEALNKYNERFAIHLDREGYSSYDYNKDFEVSASVNKKELGDFAILFAAQIDEYGYQIDKQEDLLESRINDSTLVLEVDRDDIEHYESELAFTGYFKGSGHDLSLSEQFKCYIELEIFGILESDMGDFPVWKFSVIKAFISYTKRNYEDALTKFHSAFEMFLKEAIVDKENVDTRKFSTLFSTAIKQNGLTNSDLAVPKKKTDNESKDDEVYRAKYSEYNRLKEKRNTNTHEKHTKVSKEDVENIGYIMITFVYSFMYQKNMFLNPWIKGLPKV